MKFKENIIRANITSEFNKTGFEKAYVGIMTPFS